MMIDPKQLKDVNFLSQESTGMTKEETEAYAKEHGMNFIDATSIEDKEMKFPLEKSYADELVDKGLAVQTGNGFEMTETGNQVMKNGINKLYMKEMPRFSVRVKVDSEPGKELVAIFDNFEKVIDVMTKHLNSIWNERLTLPIRFIIEKTNDAEDTYHLLADGTKTKAELPAETMISSVTPRG